MSHLAPVTIGWSATERQTLVRSPLLADLKASTVDLLLAHAERLGIVRPTLLFNPDSPPQALHILIKGDVRLLGPDGLFLDLVQPGQSFGETAVLGAHALALAAQAQPGAVIARLPRAVVLEAIERDCGLALALMRALAAWCESHRQDIHDLRRLSPSERLARFLVRTSHAPGRQGQRLPMRKRALAERLGMTPESLARAITRLAEHGVKRTGENRIAITDRAALCRYAGLPPSAEAGNAPHAQAA